MEITKDSKVKLLYQLFLNGPEGEMFESVDNEEPLEFTIGEGEMLEFLEAHIIGMKVGDKFELNIAKEDAYGEATEESIGVFPHDVFADDDTELPEAGTFVPMVDEDGNEYEAFVANVTDEEVFLDFNHPLAGEDLYVKGEILAIN